MNKNDFLYYLYQNNYNNIFENTYNITERYGLPYAVSMISKYQPQTTLNSNSLFYKIQYTNDILINCGKTGISSKLKPDSYMAQKSTVSATSQIFGYPAKKYSLLMFEEYVEYAGITSINYGTYCFGISNRPLLWDIGYTCSIPNLDSHYADIDYIPTYESVGPFEQNTLWFWNGGNNCLTPVEPYNDNQFTNLYTHLIENNNNDIPLIYEGITLTNYIFIDKTKNIMYQAIENKAANYFKYVSGFKLPITLTDNMGFVFGVGWTTSSESDGLKIKIKWKTVDYTNNNLINWLKWITI